MSSTKATSRELLSILRPLLPTLAVSIVLGIVGGLSVTALLARINALMHSEQAIASAVMLGFAGLCALALGCAIAANIGTNYVGQQVIARLRISLGGKVLCAPIEQLERYRSHRLIPVLTHDIDTVSDFTFGLPQLIVSLTVTLGCLGYLAMLDGTLFLITASAVVLGCIAQYVARSHGMGGFEAAREEEDQLQKYYRSMAEGAKELRMHRQRRHTLYREQVIPTVQRIAALQIRSVNIFLSASTFGSLLFFMVIGLCLAQQTWGVPVENSVLSGFIMTLLFMKGPMESVLSLLPLISRNAVALKRIADMNAAFSTPEPFLLPANETGARPVLKSLELRGLTYAFPSVDGLPPFRMGPFDLTVTPGELLFIVGQNGSGKTTLIKLLLGLYEPDSGQVLLNGQAVGPAQRDDYRQLFTTVFADFFLFQELLERKGVLPEHTQAYLERLELAHKVTIRDGAFSTTDLSTGQRKRLALLHAWLDERPVLVFDEWAADQDPAFRKVFYTELLPDLKRQGKTVIVISHDDRYFDLADQLIEVRGGQLHPLTERA
ncbi:cyclic peptide export ABC transporter [Pseudomonas guariconensis]|uniref:Pyoverdine biosynthesis protein n=3 Tax=Pseudomonas TaxID=286 RepID=A0A190KT38_9PSED|nr:MULTISPECIES: cyclic peptide export ABC transporter [Pseudomonas]AJW67538.1 pyoverdine biosynthesis protein [Pseudomonas taiwanensis]MDM9594361.1 cyclic peptide export ABC transporter [Pseudomonas guariconensis]MDM9607191.1 cyclic peptide export ABC transporter [Pseudomonas guariconensis]MDM9612147.1 cyclic peptide export ABC transporter [Pseudomonas guariconensis]MEB3840535.1 cyclic peptide export ABC transporter [Pseudomonas guariconensis]